MYNLSKLGTHGLYFECINNVLGIVLKQLEEFSPSFMSPLWQNNLIETEREREREGETGRDKETVSISMIHAPTILNNHKRIYFRQVSTWLGFLENKTIEKNLSAAQ